MESNPIQVFKNNLLPLLLLEFVHWIAHVCQRKPQKNYRLSPLTSLRNRAALCSPYLSTCLIREKKNPTKNPKNVTPSDCWDGCPHAGRLAVPRDVSRDGWGGCCGGRCLLWGEMPAACPGPACSTRGREEGPCSLLCCGLLWWPQECWQVPLHLSKGDKSACPNPCTSAYPAASL